MGRDSPDPVVLDASAILAYLQREPGYERVRGALAGGGAVVASVNLAEVAAKVAARGHDACAVVGRLEALGLRVEEFTRADALEAGALRALAPWLSLGDCACLALARRRGAPVLTADRAWSKLDLDVPDVEFLG